MKKYLFLTILSLLVTCINFPTRFERIEDNELRPITAVFTPYSEGAPGDTLNAKVYFAGNPVHTVSSLQLSYNVIDNIYGIADTFSNVESLSILDSTMNLPDSVELSFKVPEDALNDMLAPFIDEIILEFGPSADLMLSPEVIVSQLINPDSLFWSNIPDSIIDSIVAPSLEYIAKRAFFFITATSQNGTTLKSRAEFIVRFNSNFSDIPNVAQSIKVNNNPEIKWLGVYKVEGENSDDFDPLDSEFDGKYEFTYLYNEFDTTAEIDSVITIDKGFTYFVAADSGILEMSNGTIDTVRDSYIQQIDGRDTIVLEEFFYRWFYENLDNASQPIDSLMVLEQSVTDHVIRLYPSLDVSMKRFKIWVAVHDDYFGEFYRPRGIALRQVEGVFEYTQAYIDNIALE